MAFSGTFNACGSKEVNKEIKDIYKKLDWKINVDNKASLALPMKIVGHPCRTGEVKALYEPVPKLYYIGFQKISNKDPSTKLSLPRDNSIIKSTILSKPAYHCYYCLIFAKDDNYQCAVFFENDDYYNVAQNVHQKNTKSNSNPSLSVFYNNPELVGMFYEHTHNKDGHEGVRKFFEELQAY